MNLFKTLFGVPANRHNDPDYSESLDRIESILRGRPPAQAQFLACFALLLAQIADADQEITEGEKKRIREILRERGGLPEDQVDLIEKIALESAVHDGIEEHLVLRRLNEVADENQKSMIIRALFHVICEHDITEAESDKVGQIASGLLLPRSRFLDLRSEFKDHLRILKSLKNLPGHE